MEIERYETIGTCTVNRSTISYNCREESMEEGYMVRDTYTIFLREYADGSNGVEFAFVCDDGSDEWAEDLSYDFDGDPFVLSISGIDDICIDNEIYLPGIDYRADGDEFIIAGCDGYIPSRFECFANVDGYGNVDAFAVAVFF